MTPVVAPDQQQMYELRVVGHLDERWSSWFGEFTIDRWDDGSCTLTGPVSDQAQLHGVLARLRGIGATLLSLRTIDGDDGWLTIPSEDPTRDHGARPLDGC